MIIILLYIYFFRPFKKSFPLIVSILFVLNQLTLHHTIVNAKGISYLFLFLFLIKSLYFIKKIRIDFVFKISILLLITYFIFIVFFIFNNHITNYLVFFRKAGPLMLQFYIFIGLVYFKLYGGKLFYKYVNYAMYFFLIAWTGYVFVIPYGDRGVVGLAAYHDAIVGFAVSYLIAYNLLLKQRINAFVLIVVSILPFLGMARGGIVAIAISYLGYLFYKRNLKHITFGVLFSVIIIFLSNDLITRVLPKNIIYRHLGANSLTQLFTESEDVYKTILPRIIRWNFLSDKFINHPLFGSGLMLSTVGSGLAESQFYDVWQGHNFFLSMLAAGGLVLTLPILLLTIISIFKSIFIIIKGLDKYAFWGMILVFNVININFTNTYFISFWAGPMIWILFAAGLYELNNSGGILSVMKNKVIPV